MNKFNPEIADVAREQIGKFFKARREELGISQKELAVLTGLKRQALISDFEKGKANITINNLLALCGCLRIKPYFETGDVNQVPGFEKMNDN